MLDTIRNSINDSIVNIITSDISELGILVQTDSHITGNFVTGFNTNLIELDDTIPESNEGIQVFYLDYTPVNIGNTLYINYFSQITPASLAGGALCLALFKDSDVSAVSSSSDLHSGAVGSPKKTNGWYKETVTSILTATYKVRIGSSNSAGISMNGTSGSRLYGGSLNSGIIIYEIK